MLVDGCLWHVRPEHATAPANEGWWADKLRRNQQRDRDTDEQLRHIGWTVVRVSEHEDPIEAAARVEAALDNRVLQGMSTGFSPDHDTASTSWAREAAA